jgi:two-component system, chemotaxis family, sensor kinase CheA
MNELDDVVREFLVESYENLDRLDQDLVLLETDPANRQKLASIFRTIHTIKGTCGFLGFTRLESVSHSGENLLSRLRDGLLTLTPEITSGLLAMVDVIREILGRIEATADEGDGDYSALVDRLTALVEGPATAEPQTEAPAPEAEAPALEAPAAEAEAPRGGVSDATIRVDVALLDTLMNLVGELVLARNQILQLTTTERGAAMTGTSQRLNLITTELQERVMKTRMQPIGNVWNKLPRVVRDLALSCGKQVRVEMEGKDTELDKTIIEAIKDPLTHLVRNAVDHGIESPKQRLAAGKPAEGRLTLRAYHESGQVNIEISEDGAGVDVDRVRRRAVDQGQVTAEQAARMSDREAVGLIFLPGLSTARQVTNVSGRGVGMDVVKTNIEEIGGTVDVQSTLGTGTTFRIKIPLTLAIIPALIVSCGGQRYAIPQVSLLELVQLSGEQVRNGIELIHGTPVYRLRGNLLPLVDLARQLDLDVPARDEEVVNIVVLQADDRQFGLVVEQVNDTEEIVVKPLAKQLKALATYAGATIMGDGRVALILDVLGLAQQARVVGELHDRTLAELAERRVQAAEERMTLLVFSTPDDGRMAMPLELVDRLEEFPADSVERAGGAEVVQYRDSILPLIRVGSVLPERRGRKRNAKRERRAGPLQVIVHTDHDRSVGLMVDQILDIVEHPVSGIEPGSRTGSAGCVVVNERVTELVDLEALLARSPVPTAPAGALAKAAAR